MSSTRSLFRPKLAIVIVLCALGIYFASTRGQDEYTSGTNMGSEASTAVIERGEYLVIASNCATCHTVDGGEPYAGGLPFKTGFGTIYSTNITPDPETGIGSWTEAQFERALRAGIGADGKHLYPAFPYTSFTKIVDEDVAALYAYFQTLSPVNASNRENEMSFPYNQRWLMAGWNLLFFDQGTFVAETDRSPEWNRGAYLVESLGHCSACHTPRNALGGPVKSRRKAGGVYSDKVPTGHYRDWAAPNLTSAPTGLHHWPVEELTDYLATGRSKLHIAFGPMNEVIMNSTSRLEGDDQRAMAVYIKSLPAKENKFADNISTQELGRGQTIYDLHCGTCHQPTGLGSPETGARLVGSPTVQASDPSSLINVIIYGPELSDPSPPQHDWRPMEGFNDKINDEDIATLASYLRQMWGNKGGRVTAEQVAKQRPPFN